jgi:hypothetical protein
MSKVAPITGERVVAFEPPSPVVFKSAAKFCSEYVPLSYTVEPIIRSASLYTLTAKTGAGKTAFNVVAALAVATGRQDVLNREVVKGRVAYLACENPDDIRMRFKIAAYLLNITGVRLEIEQIHLVIEWIIAVGVVSALKGAGKLDFFERVNGQNL